MHAGMPDPPWEQTPPHRPGTPTPPRPGTPLGADTPLGSRHPPGSRASPRSRRQDTVNERPVRILLECILVLKEFRYQVKFSCSCHNICSYNHKPCLIEISLLLKHVYLKFHKHTCIPGPEEISSFLRIHCAI